MKTHCRNHWKPSPKNFCAEVACPAPLEAAKAIISHLQPKGHGIATEAPGALTQHTIFRNYQQFNSCAAGVTDLIDLMGILKQGNMIHIGQE